MVSNPNVTPSSSNPSSLIPLSSTSSSATTTTLCTKLASEKKRLFAGLLGILVLGTLTFGVVAFFRRETTSLRPSGEGPSLTITQQELDQHNTPEACWIVIHQSVYDLTEYAQYHPDPHFITLVCGLDATPLYDSVHPASLLKIVQRRQVGVILDSPPTHPVEGNTTNIQAISNESGTEETETCHLPEISIDELLLHNSPLLDCWMAIYGIVYDVTDYAPFHPNPHFVTDYCGEEVTDLFDGAHEPFVVKIVQQRSMGRFVTYNNNHNCTNDDNYSPPLLEVTNNDNSHTRPSPTTATTTSSTTGTNEPTGDVDVVVPTPTPVQLGNNVSD